ncbi:hypothetical protein QVD17_27972 [Tagetes erecta]|uniref:Protein GAMETE EXPRESSED 1 n=1 Tax=Tagetes erecta TaxID=13708 RepID=A0AAD8KG00_TARER|nr:hypothetical protein QVD17_27972 [Tagetes erecta]
MESSNSKNGMMLVGKAKRKAAWSNSCWQSAYQNLFAGCAEILAVEERRSRLAWNLSDCFQKDIGRQQFPYCDVKYPMLNCLKKLDEDAHRIYLEFYLELQSDAFKRQTERLVNELKISAEYAEDKLENIENQAERVLHTSDHIHESLSSIDDQTQQLAQTSNNVEEHVNLALDCSQSVYENTLERADSQMELQNGQIDMNVKMDEGMTMLNESANKLCEEMNKLKQASMFHAIDKLFKYLHNAIFLDPCVVKTFLVYSILIFVMYMLTSTKQAHKMRPILNILLCVTFLNELMLLQYANDIEQQSWIISSVELVFMILVSCPLILYAIYIYRGYKTSNHPMLQSLIEKVNGMQGDKKLYNDDDDDSDVDLCSWSDSDDSY